MTENDAEPVATGTATVQSLARGLAVIRAFGAATPRMTLSEVAKHTGLSRATARRFLLTLVELGYVSEDGRLFALTPRVLELGYSYLSGLTLPEVAQPHLERLSTAVGESTSASVLDTSALDVSGVDAAGADIVYLARVPVRRIMSVAINIGTRFPAYATSMGRVLLAGLPEAEARRLLQAAKLPARTAATLHTVEELLAELALVRERGWALVEQELEAGLRSMAMPVTDAAGRVLAAINVSGHSGGETLDAFRARVQGPLAEAAAAISAELARARPAR